MKKKSFKGLSLKKQTVTNLTEVKGGRDASGFLSCIEPVKTLDAGCSNHMCDSRLGGCPTYYCPRY
ncbi:hypothetical protein ACJD0Z_00615 [Flavobacteriaceae bacterium M23B6Z8]